MAQTSRFGDTAPQTATSRFGDTAQPFTPFGAAPPGVQTGQFGGSTNPRGFEQAVELFDPISQGMTFGFSDEITAPITAAITGESTEEALQRTRERSARIREEQPVASTVAEVGGGLAVAAPLAAGGAAVPALRSLPNVARFGLGGAAAGAVSGAGTSEGGLAERAGGAAQGMAIGGALGVTLPLAGQAAAATITPLLNRIPRPLRQAVTKIRDALRDDQMTAQDARDELRRLGVDATLSDAAGENVQGLARAAQSVPGPARNVGRQVFDERQRGQVQRIADSINDTLGQGTEFRQTREVLMQTRRETALPLYEGAYEIGIPATGRLRTLFERPAIRQAFERARTIAANENVRLPEIFDDAGQLLVGEGRAIPTRVMDYIQRGLSDLVEGDRNQITGAIMTEVGRGVNKSRRDLLALVDRENPVFAAARAVYAGDSASIAALEQGRRLGRGLGRQSDEFDPEQIYDDLDDMNAGEQAFFRQGLARGLIDAVESTSDTANAVRRIVGTEARRGRLRAAFPDGETFTRFMSDMNREFRFFQTRGEVLQGSITRRLGAEQDQFLEGTANQLSNPLRGGAVETAGRVLSRARRPSPEVRSELGRLLFSQSGGAQEALDLIQRPGTLRQIVEAFANPPSVPPALQRGSIAALIESERQAAALPNR